MLILHCDGTQQATKIIWSDQKDSNNLPIASGIEYTSSSSNGAAPTYTAYTTRDLILSAGAIQSPKLLQLSGIGDSTLLNKVGVEVVVENKGVGKNLQEQTIDSVGWDPKSYDFGGKGPSDVIAFPDFSTVSEKFSVIWRSSGIVKERS